MYTSPSDGTLILAVYYKRYPDGRIEREVWDRGFQLVGTEIIPESELPRGFSLGQAWVSRVTSANAPDCPSVIGGHEVRLPAPDQEPDEVDFSGGVRGKYADRYKTMLTTTQLLFFRACFKHWLELRNSSAVPSAADLDHSALLRRLLDGERAFKVPPPRAHSYPWYELAAGMECPVFDLSHRGSEILINQSRYVVIEWNEVTGGIVEYPDTKQRFRVWPRQRTAEEQEKWGPFSLWWIQLVGEPQYIENHHLPPGPIEV
jgi:hypothetical protein